MQIEITKTKYFNGPAVLRLALYGDGSTAIVLSMPSGEPLGKATVCIAEHGYTPPDGFVVIKTFEENEGLLEALIEQGVVEKPIEVKSFNSGWGGGMTDFPVCKLTDKAMEAAAAS